jgi:C1A family cysteine protease
MQTIHKYSWLPDLPDQRDYKFIPTAVKLPDSVDLRPQMPPVYDQKTLGSCVSNAIAGASEFLWMKAKNEIVPSRLFIYYNGRVIENTVNQDSGLSCRDGIKSMANNGTCPETEWPYTISKFKNKPTAKCYTDAIKHKALKYQSVSQTLTDMQSVLASGYPFVIGISVYTSFESAAVAANGIVPMPAKKEKLLGGHSTLVCGYDNSKQWFIVRNSWSASWGAAGYFFLPYTYLTNSNLSSDFWVITAEN